MTSDQRTLDTVVSRSRLSNLRRDMHPILKGLLFIYRWTVVAPVLVITTITHAGGGGVVSVLGFPGFASRVMAAQWARINAFFCMMRVTVEGRDKVDSTQSYVMVANHRSLLDIFLVYGHSHIDFKWVMKKELREVPALGFGAEKMGHVIIDRSNHDAAMKSIEAARERIRDGVSIMFFAEGTRSRTNEMLPFKKGAFRMAKDLGLPILPISLHGTAEVLPSDSVDLFPGKVKLIFHEPIPVTENDSVSDLAQRTRDVLEKALQEE